MSDWYRLPAQETLDAVSSSAHGLSHAEAARRLAQYGPNRLTPPKRRGSLLRFLLQFHNVLIYVLLASAVVTALLAHWVDTSVIVGVVVINAIICFIQEGKAEKAMDAIRRMLSLEATVLGMGLATAAVMAASSLLVSAFRSRITQEVRIPVYILIVAAMVTLVDLAMNAWMHELYKVLGLFIALIVSNCLPLARLEAFAAKEPVLPSFMDGLFMGIGFTIALTAIGAVREITGAGTLFADASLLPARVGCNKRSALHRMFCELGDKSPIPANPILFGAITIAPYAADVNGPLFLLPHAYFSCYADTHEYAPIRRA